MTHVASSGTQAVSTAMKMSNGRVEKRRISNYPNSKEVKKRTNRTS